MFRWFRWFRRARPPLLTALLTATLLVSSWASDDPTPGLFPELEPIETVSEYEGLAENSPSSVTILTAEEIAGYGHRTLADILRSMRGFYTFDDRSTTYLGVRGFGAPGDYNTRVLLLIDGQRFHHPSLRNAEVGVESPIDVDLIDRVEVVRGTGRSEEGSGALLAVIKVFTKRGRDIAGHELSLEAGTRVTRKLRYSYGERLEDGTEVLVSGARRTSDGQSFYYPEYAGSISRGDTFAEEDFLLKVGRGRFRFQVGHGNSREGLPTGAFGTAFPDTRNVSLTESDFAQVEYRDDSHPDVDLVARLDWSQREQRSDLAFSFPLSFVQQVGILNEAWGGRVDFTRRYPRGQSFRLGAEVQDNSRVELQSGALTPITAPSSFRGFHTGGRLHVAEKLFFDLHLRHDSYTNSASVNTGRAGVIWEQTPRSTWKLVSGKAFRAPSLLETSGDGQLQAANPGLQSEEARSLELSHERYLGRQYRLALTVFQARIDNLVSITTDPLTGLRIFRNLARTRQKGAEVEVSGRWSSGLRARLAITYQDGEDRATGRSLVNSPRTLGKLNVLAPLGRRDWKLGLELQYLGNRRSFQGGRLGSQTVVNATLTKSRLAKDLEASLSIYNLFDKALYDTGAVEHRQNQIEQPGRSLRLKVTKRW